MKHRALALINLLMNNIQPAMSPEKTLDLVCSGDYQEFQRVMSRERHCPPMIIQSAWHDSDGFHKIKGEGIISSDYLYMELKREFSFRDERIATSVIPYHQVALYMKNNPCHKNSHGEIDFARLSTFWHTPSGADVRAMAVERRHFNILAPYFEALFM